MRNLTMVDVCAGIGSFSLAAERAGIETLAQIEIEDKRRAILAQHFPDVKRLDDLYHVTAKDIPNGRCDILEGGTPCQDLSIAGNRSGLDGERSGLWFEFHRLITELKPSWVVWENVTGALSSNGGRDFAIILAGLIGFIPCVPDGGWNNAGFARGRRGFYNVAWRVLDAKYFGVPQRRRRIFLVASLGNGRCAEILFERESVSGNLNTRPKAWKETARNIATLTASAGGVSRPGGSGAELDFYITASDMAKASQHSPPAISALTYAKQRSDSFLPSGVGSTLTKRDHKDFGDLVIDLQQVTSKANRSQPRPYAPTLTKYSDLIVMGTQHHAGYKRARIASTLGKRQAKALNTDLVIKIDNTSSNGWGVLQDGTTHTLGGSTDAVLAFNGKSSASNSLNPSASIAPTLRKNQEPNVLQSGLVRRLTPLECERLQGFPDSWTAAESDTQRYQMLGDSIAVPCSEWVISRIAKVEKEAKLAQTA